MSPFRRRSTAPAGEYVGDPDEVTDVTIRGLDGEPRALGIEWDGGEYDEQHCWIVCDVSDLAGGP